MREGDKMSEIADLLALFGRIDQIVGENPTHPRVLETVEKMLPGTTGNQQGWYSQIERLLVRVSGQDTSGLPDYHDALTRLSTPTREPLPVVHQAKARYAATVLAQLPFNDDDREFEQLIGVLGLSSEPTTNTVVSRSTGRDMLSLINSFQPSHATWTAFLSEANDRGFVTSNEVEIQAPAQGQIRVVGDKIATQLDVTYTAPRVDFNKVREVMDPRNWPHCCDAWQKVALADPATNHAGWTRIYEVIGPDPAFANLHLTTPLLFRKDRVGDGYVVNYDLDTDHTGTKFDNFVQVDNGYIWVRPLETLAPPFGSVVYTRKVVQIQGLGVSALAMFAYALGWSTAGETLVLGCAQKLPPEGSEFPWDAPPIAGDFAAAEPQAPPIPTIDAENRRKFIKKAVDVATKRVDERAKKSAGVINRWLAGELKPRDLVDIGADAARSAVAAQIDIHEAATGLILATADTKPEAHGSETSEE
jgi:hypothetical protein